MSVGGEFGEADRRESLSDELQAEVCEDRNAGDGKPKSSFFHGVRGALARFLEFLVPDDHKERDHGGSEKLVGFWHYFLLGCGLCPGSNPQGSPKRCQVSLRY